MGGEKNIFYDESCNQEETITTTTTLPSTTTTTLPPTTTTTLPPTTTTTLPTTTTTLSPALIENIGNTHLYRNSNGTYFLFERINDSKQRKINLIVQHNTTNITGIGAHKFDNKFRIIWKEDYVFYFSEYDSSGNEIKGIKLLNEKLLKKQEELFGQDFDEDEIIGTTTTAAPTTTTTAAPTTTTTTAAPGSKTEMRSIKLVNYAWNSGVYGQMPSRIMVKNGGFYEIRKIDFQKFADELGMENTYENFIGMHVHMGGGKNVYAFIREISSKKGSLQTGCNPNVYRDSEIGGEVDGVYRFWVRVIQSGLSDPANGTPPGASYADLGIFNDIKSVVNTNNYYLPDYLCEEQVAENGGCAKDLWMVFQYINTKS